MNKWIVIAFFFLLAINVKAQEAKAITLKFKGQAITYTHFNPSNEQAWWLGARYLPQLNSEIQHEKSRLIDFEASANVYGNLSFAGFDQIESDGDLKPYRLWARYSTPQLEIRVGLQKINFGSASMLRPLMWFDQIDPRDPLKLTDGVWGILGRYYFLNNANIWMWGLYGNERAKGWEISPTAKGQPEYGGRLQYPIPLGEAAFSYHHRLASVQNPFSSIISTTDVPENRFGFDLRIDWALGSWIEASWTRMETDFKIFDNQQLINLGFDYTLGIGSGLYVAFEQLLLAYEEKAFAFEKPVSFSLISMSYPLGMFDHISAMVYYDWKNRQTYNFVNYQHQFKQIYLYAMGYWNPANFSMPTPGGGNNMFSGKGVQLMLVWNH